MKNLTLLFKTKIVLTSVLWCIPLLTFPASLFIELGMQAPEPMLFARLLGASYLALLVGYYFGLRELKNGIIPYGTLLTGIISNSSAFLILAFYGLSGTWAAWSMGAQIFLWVSTGGALFITANLIYFLIRTRRQS